MTTERTTTIGTEPPPRSQKSGSCVQCSALVGPCCDDIPTRPLNSGWMPRGCHPVIAAMPNWQQKISWPWPRAARLRRQMLKRGLRLGLPRPLTVASTKWSEWESVLNGAQCNMATPAATTYGLRERERNEVWDNPELLRFVCHNGKARGKRPNPAGEPPATKTP